MEKMMTAMTLRSVVTIKVDDCSFRINGLYMFITNQMCTIPEATMYCGVDLGHSYRYLKNIERYSTMTNRTESFQYDLATTINKKFPQYIDKLWVFEPNCFIPEFRRIVVAVKRTIRSINASYDNRYKFTDDDRSTIDSYLKSVELTDDEESMLREISEYFTDKGIEIKKDVIFKMF